MIDVEDLLGRRFASFTDCGEVAAEVLDRAGIHLSGRARSGVPLDSAIDAIISEGFTALEDGACLRDGDLLLFRVEDDVRQEGAHVWPHVGIVVDAPHFVHAMASGEVRVSSLDRAYWRHRLESCWRTGVARG
jgi:cell wall-associated NlpC family hydrolase